MTEDTDDAANAIAVYEGPEKVIAVYASDALFFGLGDTRDEAVDDVIETLNHLPGHMEAVAEDEAELIDVVPLEVTDDGDGG